MKTIHVIYAHCVGDNKQNISIIEVSLYLLLYYHCYLTVKKIKTLETKKKLLKPIHILQGIL